MQTGILLTPAIVYLNCSIIPIQSFKLLFKKASSARLTYLRILVIPTILRQNLHLFEKRAPTAIDDTAPKCAILAAAQFRSSICMPPVIHGEKIKVKNDC